MLKTTLNWRLARKEPLLHPSGEVQFSLGAPRLGAIFRPNSKVEWRGWAYEPNKKLRIRLQCNNSVSAETRCECVRPDVADSLQIPDAKLSGFHFEIPLPDSHAMQIDLQVIDQTDSLRAAYRFHFHAIQSPEQVFFLHIPKTAGSTINKFMETQFGKNACASHLEINEDWNGNKIIPRTLQQKAYLSGHIQFFVARRKLDLDNVLLATVLRDPLDQVISHIVMLKRIGLLKRTDHSDTILAIANELATVDLSSPKSLGGWIRSMPDSARKLFDNCQTRYLAAKPTRYRINDTDLVSAVESLDRFDIIGRNDHIEAFLRALAPRIGLQLPDSFTSRRENVANTKYGLDSENEELRQVLRPLYCHDEVLYRRALGYAVDESTQAQ